MKKRNLTPQKEEAKATPENKHKRKYEEFEGKENQNPTPQKEGAKEGQVEKDYENTEETFDDLLTTPTIIRSYGRAPHDYRETKNYTTPESNKSSISLTPDTNNIDQDSDHDQEVNALALGLREQILDNQRQNLITLHGNQDPNFATPHGNQAPIHWVHNLENSPVNQTQTNENNLAGVARNLLWDYYNDDNSI